MACFDPFYAGVFVLRLCAGILAPGAAGGNLCALSYLTQKLGEAIHWEAAGVGWMACFALSSRNHPVYTAVRYGFHKTNLSNQAKGKKRKTESEK
jgi:hypothetical protein